MIWVSAVSKSPSSRINELINQSTWIIIVSPNAPFKRKTLLSRARGAHALGSAISSSDKSLNAESYAFISTYIRARKYTQRAFRSGVSSTSFPKSRVLISVSRILRKESCEESEREDDYLLELRCSARLQRRLRLGCRN